MEATRNTIRVRNAHSINVNVVLNRPPHTNRVEGKALPTTAKTARMVGRIIAKQTRPAKLLAIDQFMVDGIVTVFPHEEHITKVDVSLFLRPNIVEGKHGAMAVRNGGCPVPKRSEVDETESIERLFCDVWLGEPRLEARPIPVRVLYLANQVRTV